MLPDYEPLLAAYHRAFARHLQTILDSLPLQAGQCVLDAACGDGSYCCWLGARVGTGGSAIGIDLSFPSLRLALHAARRTADASMVCFCAANIHHLPFSENTFDLVWCAQSLCSLPDIPSALDCFVRAAKAGGTVAVLENDSLHHVLLPWPPALELALSGAELRAFQDATSSPDKYYIGRCLARLLRQAGLHQVIERACTTTCQAPLAADEKAFFHEHLTRLRHRVAPHLEPAMLAELDAMIAPDSDSFLLDRDDLTVVLLDRVAWGTKPI